MDNYMIHDDQKTVTSQPILQQPIVIAAPQQPTFGRHSQQAQCQKCHKTVDTSVNFVTGTMTHVAALLLCLVSSCCCCCCIPYCIDGLKDAEHRCAECRAFLGADKIM